MSERLGRSEGEVRDIADTSSYRALFETSIDGILLVSASGIVFDANPAATHILCCEGAEIVGSRLESILDRTDPREALAFAQLNQEGRFHGELTLTRRRAELSAKTDITEALDLLRTTGKLPDHVASLPSLPSLPSSASPTTSELQPRSPAHSSESVQPAGSDSKGLSFPAELSCATYTGQDGNKRIAVVFRDITERTQVLETLRELAIRDELTGLYNRRELMRLLQEEVDSCTRYGRFASLLILDVDRFKEVNDTYGHLTGDEVLRQIARTVSSSLGDLAVAARYGGEELAIILPEMADEEAIAVAEEIRNAIARQVFVGRGSGERETEGYEGYEEQARADERSREGKAEEEGKGDKESREGRVGKESRESREGGRRTRGKRQSHSTHGGKQLLPIRVTVSLGVACFPGDADSREELITAADQALYKAKRLGRNRTVR